MRKFFTSLLLTILFLIIGAAAGAAGAYYWILNNTDICPQSEQIELTTADNSALESRLEMLEQNLTAVGASLSKLNENISTMKISAEQATKNTETMMEANDAPQAEEKKITEETTQSSAPAPSGLRLKEEDFTTVTQYTELTFADSREITAFAQEVADSLTLVDMDEDQKYVEYFIQQNDIADDSVKNQQLWIRFEQADSGEYTVAWTRARFQCQPGRGDAQWGNELCS